MNRKLPAFTIMEMIVTLVISSVAFSISAGVYLTAGRYYRDILSRYESDQEFTVFYATMNDDFQQAFRITEDHDRIFLDKESGEDVFYEFSSKSIIRQIGWQADTFAVSATDMVFTRLSPEEDLISDVSFSMEGFEKSTQVHVRKKYPRGVLFDLYQERP